MLECERCGSTDEIEAYRFGLELPVVDLCADCALGRSIVVGDLADD